MIYNHLYFHELNEILIRSAGGLLDFKGFLTCAFIKYIQVFVTVKERYYCYKLSTYCKKKKPRTKRPELKQEAHGRGIPHLNNSSCILLIRNGLLYIELS